METSQPSQDVLHAIHEFVAHLQTQLQQSNSQRDESDTRIETMLREKTEAVVELSQHYLPELSETAIDQSFRELRDDLQAFAQRRERRVEQLQADLKSLGEQIDRLEVELATSTSRLDEAVAVREKLEAEVSASLDADDQFRELSLRVLHLEQQLATFERRVTEAQHEADEKLPAYENSRLFQHLHGRQFDTPNYTRRGITRSLDRWVARLINYSRARQSYDFLYSVPDLMKAEVERRHQTLTEAVATLQDIELEHWQRFGLDEATERGQQLGAARDAQVASLEPLLKQRDALREELKSAEDAHGEFYQQAIDRLREHLDSLADNVLQRQAERTPEPTDDRIVADIVWLRDEMEQAQGERRTAEREIRTTQRRVEGMQYVLTRFRQSEFDSERSRFDTDLNLSELFKRFEADEINHIDLWRELRRQQQFDPTWVEKATQSTTDALGSETGRTLISAGTQIAATALAVIVQNKLQGRGLLRDRPGNKGLPELGKTFTKGRGF